MRTRRDLRPALPGLVASPVVKWVGGKTKLLSELVARLPDRFDRYYTAGAFGPDDQRAPADTARALVARGCKVMLSNSDTPFIRSLYRAFDIDRVKCGRAINSNAARRGDVEEVIVTGY